MVLPQKPLAEQQSPNPDPVHFLPFTLPHCPSLDTSLGALHSPNAFWQPAPQWSVVLPQYPLAEQQSPNDAPAHVLLPLAGPQDPSRVMLLSVHVPNSGWQPGTWQCASVSPHWLLDEQQDPKAELVQL